MGDSILQRIAFALEYPVVFTRTAFARDNASVAATLSRREPGRRHRFVAIVDGGVAARWPELFADIEAYARHHDLELAAPPWTVPGGEPAKQASIVDELHRRLAALHIDRHSFVIAIGGGAMLDVVGYAAATLHRGVRLVRMPTTVLGQNDAGVGVKNGINAFGAKNFLGTFAAPFAVINDSRFLATLEPRDRIAGMAEAVKVALIRDAGFFTWLVEHAAALAAFETEAVEHMIHRCAELHLAHIAGGGDPFEQGNARPLDFGHWAAHKLEMLTEHAVRHGEAVAIGMALDSRYAVEAGLLSEREYAAIVGLLGRLGLPVWHDVLRDPALSAGLGEFREHLGGELCLTLVSGLGHPIEVREIDGALLARAIEQLDPARRVAAQLG
ncbi:MAG: aroB1 [Myxococcales bacterium]|nr:aroB1 [Myxococcales bacterium]